MSATTTPRAARGGQAIHSAATAATPNSLRGRAGAAVGCCCWCRLWPAQSGGAAPCGFRRARPPERCSMVKRPSPAKAERTFRVGVFNIHGGRGSDRVRDLARTADCLRGFDLIGLNEVLGPGFLEQTDQCTRLGELVSKRFLYAPTETRYLDVAFGNGMLTNLPVASWQRIPLPKAGAHTYRNVLHSTVEIAEKRVQVLLTHLDSRDPARRRSNSASWAIFFLSLAAARDLDGRYELAP